MSKVSFANLKLKIDNSIKSFDFKGQKIDVLQYLPSEDKDDLINITLQKAERDGVYDLVLLDMYFQLNLVYMYSNLSFTDKQKENEFKLYDALKSNGFFEGFYSVLPEHEYEELFDAVEEMREMLLRYRNTAGAVLQAVIQDLPRNAQVAADIVNSFDKTKYQSVIDFATAANGGRNINTNE